MIDVINKEQVQQINELFGREGVHTAIGKFYVYVCSLFAISEYYNDKRYSGYPDYYSAWTSAHNSYLGKYFVDQPKDMPNLTSTLINGLAAQVTDSVGSDFVTEITPDLFDGDIDEAYSVLGPSNLSRRKQAYDNLKILAVLYLRVLAYMNDYPKRVLRIQKDNLVCELKSFSAEAWRANEQYFKLLEFDDQFENLWLAIQGVPYNPKSVSTKGLAVISEDMKKQGFSNDDILKVFFCIKSLNRFDVGSIDNLYAYTRNVFLREHKAMRPNESMTDTADELSPGEVFFLTEDKFRKQYKAWKKIDAIDFIRGLLFKKAKSALEIENNIAFTYLKRWLNNPDQCTLVVDPNPDFVQKVINDDRIAMTTPIFMFWSKTLAQVYKQRFPEARIACFDESCELRFQLIDDCHWGKELRFLSSQVAERINNGIIFVRKENAERTTELLAHLARTSMIERELYILAPNSMFDNQPVREKICSGYHCNWIQLLPRDKDSDWLKKMLLISLVPYEIIKNTSTVKVVQSNVFEYRDGSNLIIQDPWPIRIPRNTFMTSPKTVNKLWEEFRPKPEHDQPRVTRCFEFSEEIKIWYNWSKGRGRFQYYRQPSQEQLKENLLPRGKRITAKREFRANDIEEAEKLFEKALYSDSLRRIVQNDLEKTFKNKPMTLKSFWFLNYDILQTKNGYKEELAKKLFESKQISGLMSNQGYDLDTYKTIMETNFAQSSKSEFAKLWVHLNMILNLAKAEGRFYPNPVAEYVAELVETNRAHDQVRHNLAKRSYENDEELRMLSCLNEHVPVQGSFVGAAISFYTGMELKEICALDWEDYQRVLGCHQFWITKNATSGGDVKPISEEYPYRYRRMPVPDELERILEKRKKHVLLQTKLAGQAVSERVFGGWPIVSDDTLFSERCKVTEIRKAKKEMELAAGIEQIEGTVAGEAGITQIQFNEYHGDRFRSNFRYRALNSCKLSQAELKYVLGLTPETTFSKHYCDYSNDFAQLMLCRKLSRWSHERDSSNQNGIEKGIKMDGKPLKLSPLFKRSQISIRLNLGKLDDAPAEREIVISVEADHGADVEVHRIAKTQGER